MSEKKKYHQLGKIMNSDKGRYIALGNNNPKGDPKYNYDVEFVIKDKTGKIVHKQTNGFVSITDPRLPLPGKEEGRNVPDAIAFELSVKGQ